MKTSIFCGATLCLSLGLISFEALAARSAWSASSDSATASAVQVLNLNPNRENPTGESPICSVPPGYTAIRTIQEFDAIRINTTGKFFLCEDLDFGGAIFNPMGIFSGTLDGNGHKISHLRFRLNADCQTGTCGINSLFSQLFGATVEDLTIENVTAEGSRGGTLATTILGNSVIRRVSIQGATTICQRLDNDAAPISGAILAESISDSTLEDVKVHGFVMAPNAAAVAVSVYRSTLKRVHVNATVRGNGLSYTNNGVALATYVGGMFVFAKSLDIEDSSFTGSVEQIAVSLFSPTAGLIAWLNKSNTPTRIKNVNFQGSIVGGAYKVGGAVGSVYFPNEEWTYCRLDTDCANPDLVRLENVNVNTQMSNIVDPNMLTIMGGLIGATNTSLSLINSHAQGTMTYPALSNVGGLIGRLERDASSDPIDQGLVIVNDNSTYQFVPGLVPIGYLGNGY